MIIGIDCTALKAGYKGGINTFTFGLIKGLINKGQKHQFVIFATSNNLTLFKIINKNNNVKIVIIKNYLWLINIIFNLISLIVGNEYIYVKINNFFKSTQTKIIDNKSDFIYVPTTLLNTYNNVKPTLISMHDIQHVHYPEFFSKIQLLYRKMVFSISAKKSKYIQASSNFIKNDILKTYDFVKEKQIVVIPEGVDIDRFSVEKVSQDVLKKYKLNGKYLFFPAQLWKHKNHITLLQALKKAKKYSQFPIELVLTGQKYSASEDIFNFIKKHNLKNVHYLGKVNDEDLVVLYQNAHFLITMALYESSSLPILEAAASGVPIIASNTPPNLEMCKRLKLNLFDTLDSDNLLDLINKIWNDEKLRRNQIEINKKNISYYSWDATATRFLNFVDSTNNNSYR